MAEFWQRRRRAFDALVLLAALAAAGAVSVAGHHGAQLVYIAGVGPQGHLVMNGHHHEHEHGIDTDAADAAHDDHHHDGATPADDHDHDHDADAHAEDEHRAAPGAASQPAASKMTDMPGMSVPNPTDKHRFEANNPAHEQPKKAH